MMNTHNLDSSSQWDAVKQICSLLSQEFADEFSSDALVWNAFNVQLPVNGSGILHFWLDELTTWNNESFTEAEKSGN